MVILTIISQKVELYFSPGASTMARVELNIKK